MPAHLHALCFDAHDPEGLARFWSGVLGRELVDDPMGPTLLPDDGNELCVVRTGGGSPGPW